MLGYDRPLHATDLTFLSSRSGHFLCLSSLVVPAQNPYGAKSVPPAGPTIAFLKRKIDLAGMRVLQQPSTIRLPLGTKQIDCFIHPRIRRTSDRAEVFEAAQHVVVPAGWKRELQPGWVDDPAGALSSEQFSFEDVLLALVPSRDGFPGAT